jgi:hypothetical protein
LALGPKYFSIAAWEAKAEMAPAMKSAGTRQEITCKDKYSIKPLSPPSKISIAVINYYFLICALLYIFP